MNDPLWNLRQHTRDDVAFKRNCALTTYSFLARTTLIALAISWINARSIQRSILFHKCSSGIGILMNKKKE